MARWLVAGRLVARWLGAGGWWLVAGGWWLVAGGWWLYSPRPKTQDLHIYRHTDHKHRKKKNSSICENKNHLKAQFINLMRNCNISS